MSHHDPLFALNLALEHATLPRLAHARFLQRQRTQTMRCESSAAYNVSRRRPPPLNRR